MIIFNKKGMIFISISLYIALCASISSAANISFDREELSVVIKIVGNIEEGDYLKFEKVVKRAFAESTAAYEWNIASLEKHDKKKYHELKAMTGIIGGAVSTTVSLDSNGGLLAESIKIGRAVREMALKTEIAENSEATCISACFFIWISGIERNVSYKNSTRSLGVHRIYFDPRDYKDLTSIEAEKKYTRTREAAIEYLLSMGASESIVNRILRTPSNEVYFLNKAEIELLAGLVPYYDELLISRCGSYSKDEEADYLECHIMYPKLGEDPYKRLEFSAKDRIAKKCSSLSNGYIAYLKEAYIGKRRCRNLQDDIERWKRMATYLSFGHLIPK